MANDGSAPLASLASKTLVLDAARKGMQQEMEPKHPFFGCDLFCWNSVSLRFALATSGDGNMTNAFQQFSRALNMQAKQRNSGTKLMHVA